jgi:energy-coupling factor transporter ATP-binding protein EcfA2
MYVAFPPANDLGATWTAFTGDNGTGKTTLLRCIAMALSGQSGPSALLSELFGEWLRVPTQPAEIILEMQELNGGSRKHVITTTITPASGGDYSIQQSVEGALKLDRMFVCGYGIGRGLMATTSYENYLSTDSVYSLFKYSAALQNPELAIRRLKDQQVDEAELLAWIDRMLMLPRGSTKLGRNGITVSGPWGTDITFGALGDGYQGTITLLCDLLHWSLLFDEHVFEHRSLRGLVLIDQLEENLHPRWQRAILRLLQQQFPQLQFIVTTHSPMCALGTADLPEHNSQLILLRQEPLHGVRALSLPSFAGWRADQVLTSDAFGLLTSRSVETEERLMRLRELELKEGRSPDEEAEYAQILAELRQDAPPAAESAVQQKIQDRIAKLLDELSATLPKQ